MQKGHQQTQVQLQRGSINDFKTYDKVTSGNRGFANTSSKDVQNSLMRSKGPERLQQKKPSKLQPLKDSTNLQNKLPNVIIKIKPKNTEQNKNIEQNMNIENQIEEENIQCNKQKQRNCQKLNKQTIQTFIKSKLILNPKQFILKPVQKGEVSKFVIHRQPTLFQNNLQIVIKGMQDQIISSERVFKLFGTKIMLNLPQKNDILSVNQSDKLSQKSYNSKLGWMQSNFDGSIFNVYETNGSGQSHQIVATIEYSSFVGSYGDPRKIKIYLRDRSMPNVIFDLDKCSNLKKIYQQPGSSPVVHCLKLPQCHYDLQQGKYGLSFQTGGLIKPSVHNTIFLDSQDKQVLKLFKTEERQYGLWCYHPITSLVGCAFAISSFVFKLASQ